MKNISQVDKDVEFVERNISELISVDEIVKLILISEVKNDDENAYFQKILNILHDKKIRAFSILDPIKNEKLARVSYFEITHMIPQLVQIAKSESLSSIMLEIKHSFKTVFSGIYEITVPLEDLKKEIADIDEKINPEKLGWNSLFTEIFMGKLNDDCRIIKRIENEKKEEPNQMDKPIYSYQNSNGPFAVTRVPVNGKNIFIESKHMINVLNGLEGDVENFELTLCHVVQDEMLKIASLNVNNYEQKAEGYLRSQYPNIPKDALDRIIFISKPNKCRKKCWWRNG